MTEEQVEVRDSPPPYARQGREESAAGASPYSDRREAGAGAGLQLLRACLLSFRPSFCLDCTQALQRFIGILSSDAFRVDDWLEPGGGC